MKVSFGGGVADGRGSIGGTTFSRNRYGAYARKRVVPVNPRTSEQVRARTTFQAAVTAWRQLTDAQRAAWSNYAAQTPVQDKLGATIYLTGLQAFMSVQGPARTYAAHDIGFVASIPPYPRLPVASSKTTLRRSSPRVISPTHRWISPSPDRQPQAVSSPRIPENTRSCISPVRSPTKPTSSRVRGFTPVVQCRPVPNPKTRSASHSLNSLNSESSRRQGRSFS